MTKDDLFKMGKRAKDMFQELEEGIYSKFESDNILVKKYVDAKYQGHYKHILYEVNSPQKTAYKNMLVLRKISNIVQKPLKDLTEEDVIDLQNKLNQNEILYNDESKPISHAYKCDIVKNLKQFFAFYKAYCKYEEGREIQNVAEYLRVRKPKNVNRLVEFLKKEEVEALVNSATTLKMRALIKIFFETGARTIEILNLKKYNCNFEDGRWMIKLPNMKGISTAKMPIEIQYGHTDFNTWMEKNKFSEEDYIFDYTYDYLRIQLKKMGEKAIGRKVTPKLFRKSCAMHLVNLDINEQYIRSHMGWSAGSNAISHYISQKAIKRPEKLESSYGLIINRQNQDKINKDDEIKFLKERLEQMEAMMLQKFANVS